VDRWPLFEATINDHRDALIALRRDLHAHPELSHNEMATTAKLIARLEVMGFQVSERTEKTGFFADIARPDFDPSIHRTVAIRTDIDALPIPEQTGLAFCSTNPGVMHACGHDMHMSCVTGVAIAVSAHRDALPGRIRLFYQHAEEVAPGGAEELVAIGCMKGVDAVLALHCDPTIEVGAVGVRVGAFTAASDAFEITVRGKGGHSARPHQAVDPVFIATQAVAALYQLAGRVFDARDPVVIAVGAIQGGSIPNVIPDEVFITGTARSLSPVHRAQVEPWIRRVVGGICEMYGATFDMNLILGAPAIRNDPAVTAVVERTAAHLLGRDAVTTIELPSMGAEDFSYYLEHAPGSMFRLGVANDSPRHMLHSPHFNPDEGAINIGARILTRAALDLLSNH
jgi:amidohydrolase